jgi:DNA topoisomerase-6 subunit A
MNKKKSSEIKNKIKGLASSVSQAANAGNNPTFEIPIRTLSNSEFDKKAGIIRMGDATQGRPFLSKSTARKFMQTVLVAKGCMPLVEQGQTTSIRDMYYMLKHTIEGSKINTFDDQEESDPIIEDLEVTLDCLREELGLYASTRGALVGELTLEDSGDTINARRMGSGGWGIPSIVEPEIVKFKACDAEFILLVEKDAMWRRLNEDKFWKKHKCILVHGQGQPPRGVRRLLHRMVKELNLPLYVFVDNDPWGYYIHSVVKQGSINLAYESQRMAVPSAKFLGLSAFDRKKFDLPGSVLIDLNKKDIDRANQILGYPWIANHKGWQREIKKLLSNGFKMELEALSALGLSFVGEEYLPKKIKDRQWL